MKFEDFRREYEETERVVHEAHRAARDRPEEVARRRHTELGLSAERRYRMGSSNVVRGACWVRQGEVHIVADLEHGTIHDRRGGTPMTHHGTARDHLAVAYVICLYEDWIKGGAEPPPSGDLHLPVAWTATLGLR